MKTKLLSALLISAIAPAAFAGTCASPTAIATPTPSTVTGTTCGGDMGINLGGTILSNPTQVYSFVWHDTGTTPNILHLNSGANIEIDIANNCTDAPFAVGANLLDLDWTTAGMVDGQTYLMFVTIDPSIQPHNASQCGTFDIAPGTLPVELSKFSVN
ncbi:MAG TPA: hypothetical protein VFN09_05270 [Rhodanobacteraceae bacterium]|nr:hypothetical protein [Rhodanobacteraceae bacterium]